MANSSLCQLKMPKVKITKPIGIGMLSNQLSQKTSLGIWMNSSKKSIHQENTKQDKPKDNNKVTRPAGRLRNNKISQNNARIVVPASAMTSSHLMDCHGFKSPAIQ